MPRDGSGNYTRPVNSVDPAVTNTTISSTDFNQLTLDLATEMTDSVDRSGKGALLANLNAGGFKIVSLGTPSAIADAARLTDTAITGDVTKAYNSTAATVSAIGGVTVTGETGTGKVVFDTGATIGTPTINTPAIADATHTGITKIAGLTAGAYPAAGNIGAVQTNSNSTSIGNTNVVSVVSVSLTAGNWLIFGYVTFTPTGNFSFCTAGIGSALNSLTGLITFNSFVQPSQAFTGNAPLSFSVGTGVLTQAGTAPWYMTCQTGFNSGSVTAACVLTAVRIS